MTKTSPERLQKVIARSGLTSRRGAERLISQGRVEVNGTVALPGRKVDPTNVQVLVDGVPLPVTPERVYYLLHKPAGVVTTTDDPYGRRMVIDMVPSHPRVFPVGRLDADTTGLILLTNDGTLANLVAHPSHGLTKTYVVMVIGQPLWEDLDRMTEGIELEDGPARARSARLIGRGGSKTHLELVMGEGRNREVRRLCEAAGFPVVALHRTAIGNLRDRDLQAGQWRELSITEVRNLYQQGGENATLEATAPVATGSAASGEGQSSGDE